MTEAAGSALRLHLPVLGESRPVAIPAAPAHLPTALADGLGRHIEYVRVSLTDRCNYRCTYCMPEAGVEIVPKPDILSFEEIEQVVRALVAVGVRRVRLTGGEPTVRKDLVQLVGRLGQLGLEDLALSTNGEALAELAEPLRRAGLQRLNVSIDTLSAERFRRITRRGHLERVLAGLAAARAAGFTNTKLNTVAIRGFNDDELGALCRYAFDNDFTPRFIEFMPMSDGALYVPGTYLPAAEIRATLEAELGELRPDGDARALPGVGPARYQRISYGGRLHRVGIIGAVSEPFCDTCNRVRISATGQLHACLAYDDAIDLRSILRGGREAGRPESDLQGVLVATMAEGLLRKRPGHTFSDGGCGAPKKHMVSIGG